MMLTRVSRRQNQVPLYPLAPIPYPHEGIVDHGGVDSGRGFLHRGSLRRFDGEVALYSEKPVLGVLVIVFPVHRKPGKVGVPSARSSRIMARSCGGDVTLLYDSLLVHFSGCSLPNFGTEGCSWEVFWSLTSQKRWNRKGRTTAVATLDPGFGKAIQEP